MLACSLFPSLSSKGSRISTRMHQMDGRSNRQADKLEIFPHTVSKRPFQSIDLVLYKSAGQTNIIAIIIYNSTFDNLYHSKYIKKYEREKKRELFSNVTKMLHVKSLIPKLLYCAGGNIISYFHRDPRGRVWQGSHSTAQLVCVYENLLFSFWSKSLSFSFQLVTVCEKRRRRKKSHYLLIEE